MTFRRRLENLEAAYRAEKEASSPGWLEDAYDQAEEALGRLEALGLGGEEVAGVAELLRDNLGKVAWCASRGMRPRADAPDPFLSWPDALVRFLGRAPEDLRPAAVRALVREAGERGDRRLSSWLWSVSSHTSRLPPDLPAEVMGRLLAVYLERPGEIDGFSMVCDGCGLLRPTRKRPPLSEWRLARGCGPDERPLRYDFPPDFFDRCPACGCTEWMWDGRTRERHYPWHDLD